MISLVTGGVLIGDQTRRTSQQLSFRRPLAVTVAPSGNQYKVIFNEWAFGLNPAYDVVIERSKIMSQMVPLESLKKLYLKQIAPPVVEASPKEPPAPIVPSTEEKPVENIGETEDTIRTDLTEEEQIARAQAFLNFVKPTIH